MLWQHVGLHGKPDQTLETVRDSTIIQADNAGAIL